LIGVPLILPMPWLGLLLLGVSGVLWLWLRRHRRRKLWQLGIGVAMLLMLSVIAEPGLMLGIPSDPGTKADAIVILGRGETIDGDRVAIAKKLWQQGRAPVIYISGVYDGPRIQRLLQATGIPKQAIDGDNCSMTTPENALFTAAILQARQVRKIILVTDPPHSWRSRIEYQQNGFEVISHPSHLPPSFIGPDRFLLIAREYFFLCTTTIGYQLGYSSPNPERETLLEAARAYGRRRLPQTSPTLSPTSAPSAPSSPGNR
jgi:uncharacterized SAM-binding protein YcdF (DUF218 family)